MIKTSTDVGTRKYSVLNLLFLHDPVAGGRHAVDTHVRGSMLVADGDGESSKVSSDDLDCLISGTRDFQILSFAFISRLVSRPVRTNS